MQNLLVAVLLVCLSLPTNGTDLIRGVSASQQSRYTQNPVTFTCLDGKQQVPARQINDDYCDCVDGSDEPGTSACASAGGSFHCANRLYKAMDIPSSRVNDAFCDCCDGSDEHDGVVTCPNTCKEIGEAWRAEQRATRRALAEGAKVKASYIEQGKEARKEREELLADLTVLLEEVKPRLEDLQGKKDAAERLRNIADARLKRLEDEADAARKAEEAAMKAEDADEEADDDDDAAELERERIEDEDEDEDESESENDQASDEPTTEETEAAATSTFETTEEGFEGMKLVPPGEEEAFKDAFEEARSAWQTAKDEHDRLDREKTELEGKLAADLGPDDEFQPIQGKCFQMKDLEYTWEVCPFDKSTQTSLSGGGGTSLGKWGEWKEAHTKMLLDKGQSCWQGPQRSMEIHFKCGAEDKLISVDEPSKCTYTCVFTTPAACSIAHAEIEELNIEGADEHY